MECRLRETSRASTDSSATSTRLFSMPFSSLDRPLVLTRRSSGGKLAVLSSLVRLNVHQLGRVLALER